MPRLIVSDEESSEDEADSEIVDILQHDSSYRDLENPMAQSVNQLAVNNPQALLSLAENNLDVEAVLASQECPYDDSISLAETLPHNNDKISDTLGESIRFSANIQSGRALDIEAEVARALRIRDDRGEPSKYPDVSVVDQEVTAQVQEHVPDDFSCEENVEMILENNGMSLNHDFNGVDVNPAELFSVASPLSSDHVTTPEVVNVVAQLSEAPFPSGPPVRPSVIVSTPVRRPIHFGPLPFHQGNDQASQREVLSYLAPAAMSIGSLCR